MSLVYYGGLSIVHKRQDSGGTEKNHFLRYFIYYLLFFWLLNKEYAVVCEQTQDFWTCYYNIIIGKTIKGRERRQEMYKRENSFYY